MGEAATAVRSHNVGMGRRIHTTARDRTTARFQSDTQQGNPRTASNKRIARARRRLGGRTGIHTAGSPLLPHRPRDRTHTGFDTLGGMGLHTVRHGSGLGPAAATTDEIIVLIEKRNNAKNMQDFGAADALRVQLEAIGVALGDRGRN